MPPRAGSGRCRLPWIGVAVGAVILIVLIVALTGGDDDEVAASTTTTTAGETTTTTEGETTTTSEGETTTTTEPAVPFTTFGMLLVGPENDRGWSQAHREGGEYIEEHMGAEMILIDSVNPADRPETSIEQIVDCIHASA